MGDEENEFLTNDPYFDLNEAIENYGFDFESFQENNFESFIQGLIDDYTLIRKSFILKDLCKARSIAHKFKGLFL